jgi:hypothetical protein
MICTMMEAAKVMPNRLAWQGHITHFPAEVVKHFYSPQQSCQVGAIVNSCITEINIRLVLSVYCIYVSVI